MNRRELLRTLAALATGVPITAKFATAMEEPRLCYEIETGQGLKIHHPSLAQNGERASRDSVSTEAKIEASPMESLGFSRHEPPDFMLQ